MIPAISLQKAQACNHFWARCLMIKRCRKWFLARDGLRRRCSACLRGAHRSRPSRSHAASARVIRLSLAMLSLSRLASMVRGGRRLGVPLGRLAVITPPNRGLRAPVGRRRARFEIPLADHARNRSAEPPPRLVLSPHLRSRLSRRGRSNGRAEGLPSVDDLAQTGDDSPQFSPRFWTCRFGIAGGHSPPFGCRLVCVRFPLIWFTSNEPDQGLFVRHSSLRPPVPCGVSVSWSSVFLSLVTRLSA